MTRFHALSVVAFILAGAMSAYAQFSPGQNAAARSGDITLTGTVVNGVTGDPIGRALVQIGGMQPQAVLADASGRFQFDGLAEGRVMLFARKPGFFSDQELHRGGRPMFVQVTENMTPVALTLTPAGIITGHITTREGDPIEGADLRLKRHIIQNGRGEWIEQSGARTDEDGAFRMANLMPGDYYLFAAASRFGRVATDDVFAPAYYPGASDMASAAPLRVQPGQTITADVSLEKEKPYRIAGVVTGIPDGQSAFVQITGPGGQTMGAGGVRQDGNTFEFRGIPAGTYTLRAQSQQRFPFGRGFGGGPRTPSQMPERYVGTVQVNVSGDMSGITIALQQTASIPVTVRTEFSQTNNIGAGISLGPNRRVPQYVQMMLQASDGQVYGMQPDESGSSVFRNIEPGRYRVVFNSFGMNTYVASASFGNVDLLRDDLVIISGGEQQPIELVVRDDAPTISGTANCGDVQCWVLVVPDGNRAESARQIPVDRYGVFHATSVAPGSYRVYAFDRIDGIEYNSPDAMKAYSSHAETVSLSAGQKAQVTLELTKAVNE